MLLDILTFPQRLFSGVVIFLILATAIILLWILVSLIFVLITISLSMAFCLSPILILNSVVNGT